MNAVDNIEGVMEGGDTYVAQLREVFESCCCDQEEGGSLDEEGLRLLCHKLQLSSHADVLIGHLLHENTEVNFEEFKECFVAILSQEIPSSDDSSKFSGSEDRAEREVSPKFILGRKKYGRRSRPASVVDEDATIPVVDQQRPHSSPAATTGSGETTCKRPMSPNDCSQPPTKTGRMLQGDSPSPPSSSNNSPEHPSFESDPIECLRETWKKLGVGQDGFLNVQELAHVCEHIGMDMTEEVVVQLFQKLDCDQDGQISFEEFLQGLFQHGDPNQCDSPDAYNSSADDRQLSNAWPSGIFSSIDPGHSGCGAASSVLDLWDSLELKRGCRPRLILEELGYSPNSQINLSELTTTLEDILTSALKRPVLQLAFATFQNELHYLRQTIDQMREERRKLRVNVEEANARAALLAQEVDDNHAKLENSLQKKLMLLEKKYQDQVRELSEELQQERDLVHSQSHQLKQFRQELTSAQDEEARSRARCTLLQQENSRLELELRESSEKCLVAEKLNEALQKELLTLPALKKKLSELESQLLQEQQHQSLILELESCKRNNQELQDKIDELTLEMENIHHQRSSASVPPPKGGSVVRNHSWLSDYKRRGSDSSEEENSDEDGIIINGMKETVPNEDVPVPEAAGSNKNFTSAVLLRDLFMDQSVLLQRLRAAEERCLRTDSEHRRAQLKIRTLSQILLSLQQHSN